MTLNGDGPTLRELIALEGGLVSIKQMAEEFDVSRQRAWEHAQHPTFPEPIADHQLWIGNEVRAWRADRVRAYGGKQVTE